MLVKGMILEFGEVPPGGGAARNAYRFEHGTIAFDEAQALLETARTRAGGSVPKVLRIPHRDPAAFRVDPEFEVVEFRRALTEDDAVAAGGIAAKAELAAVRALNFLEDFPDLVNTSHHLLHQAAALRSTLIGCPVTLGDDGIVWIDCPSRLSHSRVGQSVGMTTRYVCSICGEPVEDCLHFPGQLYDVEAMLSESGICNICSEPACDHEPGLVYEVTAQPVIKDALLHEVSLVSRPRYPQARISAFGLDFDRESEEYRGATSGIFHCTFCLGPCRGLVEMGPDPSWLLENLLWENSDSL